MSDKTRSMVPRFYLVNPQQSLCVTESMTLGRYKGNFVLEDENLSATHCEFIPRLLAFYIKDLNSTNGVFVNKQKIFPNTEVKLEAGDHVRVGNLEFTFYDNELEALKASHGAIKIKEQPKFALNLQSLVSFFGVSIEWNFLYTLVLFATAANLILNLRLDVVLPSELEFMNKLYGELIIPEGIKAIFFVYCLCLLHAFCIKVLFKTKFHRLMSTVPYLVALFFLVNFQLGPVPYIKQYVTNRAQVLFVKRDIAAISQIKDLTKAETELTASFNRLEHKISVDDKNQLMADFKKLKKEILSKKINI